MAEQQATVMVVDDTPANLGLLQRILREKGYRTVAFPRGSLALKAAARQAPDLILLDIQMPDMDGYEVCRQLKADPALRDVPVLFISALSEPMDKIRAFDLGGLDYVTKPFQQEEVLARVNTHLRLRAMQMELTAYSQGLEQLVREQVQEISRSQLATIHALSELLETRDYETGEHTERTRNFCRLLAQTLRNTPQYALEVSDAFIEHIHQAAPLHDIGKFGIPDSILLKPGKLDAAEFETIKSHTTIGATTLRKAYDRHPKNAFLRMGIEIARSHHEKWDGSGYPDGLCGEGIPLSARIMALADVYDALRAERRYKPPYTHQQAVRIITESMGTHFDPGLGPAFHRVADSFAKAWEENGEPQGATDRSP